MPIMYVFFVSWNRNKNYVCLLLQQRNYSGGYSGGQIRDVYVVSEIQEYILPRKKQLKTPVALAYLYINRGRYVTRVCARVDVSRLFFVAEAAATPPTRRSRRPRGEAAALRARGEAARGKAASCCGKAARGEAAYNLVHY